MGKKNKKKNISPVNSAQAETKQQETLTVDNNAIEEYLTTEEGKIAAKEIEDYTAAKKQEADEYYESKKQEADKIAAIAEEVIQKKVEAEIKQKEKELQEKYEKEKEKLNERQDELDKAHDEVTQKMSALQKEKDNIKTDINKEIQAQLDELKELKLELKGKEREIESLEDDNKFLEDEMSKNEDYRKKYKEEELKNKDLKENNELYEKKNNELKEENKKLKEQILEYGDAPKTAIIENSELKKKIEELESRIVNCPAEDDIQELRNKAGKYEELNNKLEKLENEKINLIEENTELTFNKKEIENYRKYIKLLELQKNELQNELDRNIEAYRDRQGKIFANLSEIDEEECYDYPEYSGIQNLKTLCERFRGYMANRPHNPLYYEESIIRTFIAGFASSRITILEGLSGTGKSSLPQAFAEFMGSKTIKVPVQSSWTDRNDLLGFYNDFKKQYKETPFLKALYRATHDRNNIYIILLDEMNLSRIEYYFADFLSVLEDPKIEKWKIELVSDYASITHDNWPKLIQNGEIQICDNTWFVGTANKDDSTQMITDKVYDRATILNFEEKGTNPNIAKYDPINMSNEQFKKLLRNSSKFKDEESKKRFCIMLKDLDEQVRLYFDITFGNRIANQLEKFVPVYIACGGTVDEAIDMMFSRKILRKLEGKYDDSTKRYLDELKTYIHDEYKMPITEKAIGKMIDKI